jgi:hypothetical protein
MGSLRSLHKERRVKKHVIIVSEDKYLTPLYEAIKQFGYTTESCRSYRELEERLTLLVREKKRFPDLAIVDEFFACPQLGTIANQEGRAIVYYTKRLCEYYERPEIPCLLYDDRYELIAKLKEIKNQD